MEARKREWCLHIDTQRWLEEAGESGPWLTVYRGNNAEKNKADVEDPLIWSFLVKNESIEDELTEYTFNQFDGYPVTERFDDGDTVTFYSRYGYEDREPLFYRRSFTGKKGYLELSQEFIHFFQLYYDQPNSRYLLISPDGGEETVVQIKDNKEISILTRRIRQFLAFKGMSLVLCVVIRRFFNEPIGEEYNPTNAKQVLVRRDKYFHYALWYQDFSGDPRFFTELIGKKVIPAIPLEKTGIYPFQAAEQFEKFIIGETENGDPIEYICDPEGLSDYYGKNPGKPHYLTPVFFRREVLAKYYSDPAKYRVEDGSVRIGDYILRADTNHPDYVMVYLGDLGRDISYSEQRYWRSYNIIPSGRMSVTAFRRNFLGEFADPESENFIFKNRFDTLQEIWREKFGWLLFKPLNDADQYRLDNIHIPLHENQQEFDQQVEALSVLLIDSLNQDAMGRSIQKRDECKRSIQCLELFFQTHKVVGFEEHLAFLHSLYRLRSQGSSHRKDTKDYPKVRAEFKLDELGYINAFRNILIQMIGLLEFCIAFASEKGNTGHE